QVHAFLAQAFHHDLGAIELWHVGPLLVLARTRAFVMSCLVRPLRPDRRLAAAARGRYSRRSSASMRGSDDPARRRGATSRPRRPRAGAHGFVRARGIAEAGATSSVGCMVVGVRVISPRGAAGKKKS